jgi:membrane protease subunit HflK
MAWNDNPKSNKPEGPPDLEEALRQFQKKLQSLFGGTPKGPKGDFDLEKHLTAKKNSFWFMLGIILLVYLLSGIYVVQQAERAVITRFGRYVRTELPGPHWMPWFIESRNIENVEQVSNSIHGGQMLTRDENIVSAEIAVQYRISNLQEYLFNTVGPKKTLEQVSESALRQVVGQSSLDEVLTTGRAKIVVETRKLIQANLDYYKAGLIISDLALQQTKAPDAVKEAFDDAIKAQQDEDRSVNEAQAYSREHVPIAEGRASRIVQDAKAYQEEVVLLAKGDAAKFALLIPEYRRAPEVTRERMYFETLEKIYAQANKLILDVEGNGNQNVIYLPIEKMMQNSGANAQSTLKKSLESQSANNLQSSAGSPDPDGDSKVENRNGLGRETERHKRSRGELS